MFFTFFKLYKCYQITQRITYKDWGRDRSLSWPSFQEIQDGIFHVGFPNFLSICYHGILLLIHEHAVWRNAMNFWNCVINLPSLEVGVSEWRIFIFSRTTRNFLVTVFWFYQENVPCRNILAPNPLTLVWHIANFNYSAPMKLYWTIFSYGL